jgi:hypothetical protein
MSIEIDKLKIENKMLSDRNDELEDKLLKRRTAGKVGEGNDLRGVELQRELEYQVAWNQRIE